ncbi:MAG: hypothetical protein IT326_03780 [Anaerolineae bacterium]|nr:hypothetical protein [Anaerolineae bacterium]
MTAANGVDNREWRWVIIASASTVVLMMIPLIVGYLLAAPDRTFTGVMIIPLDGLSYQAKLAQGASGSWMFHLTYTPEPHRGVFIYTFYPALGQLARLLNVEPILVSEVFRISGTLGMYLMLYLLISLWTDDLNQRRITWGIAITSAGVGWLVLLIARGVMPDITILPEAFPLQAAYANAHFPWAIATGMWIAYTLLRITLNEPEHSPELSLATLGLALGGILLVMISPFMLALVGGAYGIYCLSLWRRDRAFPLRAVSWGTVVLIFSVPLLGYSLWATSTANPVMHQWMAQNVTLSPPVWQYLAAFGPVVVLAVIGVIGTRQFLSERDSFLLGWIGLALVALYLPINLQRRFAIGLMIPLAIYAGIGLYRVILPWVVPRWRFVLTTAVLILLAPSTVVALVLPLVGASTEQGAPYYFLSRGESAALSWLQDSADPESIVLAAPSFSLFIPIHGQRVVYAHPFETLHAEERERAVLDYYSGSDCSVVEREQVDYVVYGERERQISDAAMTCKPAGEPVYTSPDGTVLIYATAP